MVSTDSDNYDTMLETPGALRYMNASLDRGSRKGKKSKVGNQGACCGSGSDGGTCEIF